MFIRLYAVDKELATAWRREFKLKPLPAPHTVEIIEGDILQDSCEAIVSPANSFGYMDGGIDLLYTEFFGRELQKKLQDQIQGEEPWELPVGTALAVATNNEQIPYLISAPTMRTPQDLNGTVNAYLASKAALCVALTRQGGECPSIAFPGMGTGVGALPPNVAAVQMRRGFLDAIQGMQPVSSLWERGLDEKNLAVGNDTRGVHIAEAINSDG